jgi:hypothetical protein
MFSDDKPCTQCEGNGSKAILKIPFTSSYLWKQCDHCFGTGLEHRGFERSSTSNLIRDIERVCKPCGYTKMEYGGLIEYIAPDCKHQYAKCSEIMKPCEQVGFRNGSHGSIK